MAQYTLDTEVVYYRDADAKTKANPIAASNTFLYDWETMYTREMGAGESFTIYGNYFNIDISLLPLVTRESGNITPEGFIKMSPIGGCGITLFLLN